MDLSAAEIERLDAYQLLAAVGKKVVHPGGRRSTAELYELARIEPGHHVLEVGCGPGTTAVEIAQRFGARVTAVDIDEMMLAKARQAVVEAGVEDRVTIEKQDIQALGYPENAFDRVIIEAVTMFVDVSTAAREVVRVCKPDGVVVDHEFIWLRRPKAHIRNVFQTEVCRMVFEDRQMWENVYKQAGLKDVQAVSGRFVMMTPRGFVRDEGVLNTLRIGARVVRSRAFLKRVIWNLRRILPAAPYLGYVVVAGVKPQLGGADVRS